MGIKSAAPHLFTYDQLSAFYLRQEKRNKENNNKNTQKTRERRKGNVWGLLWKKQLWLLSWFCQNPDENKEISREIDLGLFCPETGSAYPKNIDGIHLVDYNLAKVYSD